MAIAALLEVVRSARGAALWQAIVLCVVSMACLSMACVGAQVSPEGYVILGCGALSDWVFHFPLGVTRSSRGWRTKALSLSLPFTASVPVLASGDGP